MKYQALAVGLLLAACNSETQPLGEQVDTQPVPRMESNGSSSGGLCMPCIGPHFNLSTGRMQFFSIGPGLGF